MDYTGSEFTLTYEDFKGFTKKYFPYHVLIGDPGYTEIGTQTIATAGPARFAYTVLADSNKIHLWLPQYNPNYWNKGTWFFVQTSFFFQLAEDAVLFKLRFA